MRITSTCAWSLIAVSGLLLMSGCAFGIAGAAMNGTRQNVFIDSKPSGANVTIEGQVGKTPAQFNLKRSRNYVAVVEKEGYESSWLLMILESTKKLTRQYCILMGFFCPIFLRQRGIFNQNGLMCC